MEIKTLLEQVRAGEITVAQAQKYIEKLPYEELDFAKLDHHRLMRSGFGETVFCQGKTPGSALRSSRALPGWGRTRSAPGPIRRTMKR